MQKFNNLEPISWPRDNILVSIATKSFQWKQTWPDFFVPDPNLPAKFGARQPVNMVNGRVDSGQMRPQTFLKF